MVVIFELYAPYGNDDMFLILSNVFYERGCELQQLLAEICQKNVNGKLIIYSFFFHNLFRPFCYFKFTWILEYLEVSKNRRGFEPTAPALAPSPILRPKVKLFIHLILETDRYIFFLEFVESYFIQILTLYLIKPIRM